MCCLDPFGMLDPHVVVNLLPAPGVVDERSCRERTKWPSEGLPKGGTHVLAVCVTIQLDDCVHCHKPVQTLQVLMASFLCRVLSAASLFEFAARLAPER